MADIIPLRAGWSPLNIVDGYVAIVHDPRSKVETRDGFIGAFDVISVLGPVEGSRRIAHEGSFQLLREATDRAIEVAKRCGRLPVLSLFVPPERLGQQ